MDKENNICTICGAPLSELHSDPNMTTSGKYTDKDHPYIIAKHCECCGREIRVFKQQITQSKYCSDCQKQRSKKKSRNNKQHGAQLALNSDVKPKYSREDAKMVAEPVNSTPENINDKFSKTFRDCVHGDIDLYEWEVDIVNTPEFQRLREIKQLGLSDLVYPGAVHTRFLHSLGTLHMAQVMIDNINLNNGRNNPIQEKQKQIIRLTALLHDIGHLPFGHTLEKECNIIKGRHDDWTRKKAYIEEKTYIGRILGAKGLYKEVTENLRKLGREHVDSSLPQYMVDIVGNTICADLLDYLRRDGHACGLNLNYDDRIFKYFAIQDSNIVVRLEKHGQYRRDNVSEILSLLRNRYSLTEKVITHHTKSAASAMLGVAFQLSDLAESDILMMGQSELLAVLAKHENERVKFLANSIKNRDLYKVFFVVTREYAGIEDKLTVLQEKLYDDSSRRRSYEKELESKFGLKDGSIIIFCPQSDMAFKPADVLVIYKSGMAPQKLNALPYDEIRDEVISLQTKHQSLWKMCLFIDPDHFHLATEIAKSFKEQMRAEGIILENYLESRPTPRFESLLIVDEIVDEFMRNKNMNFQDKRKLHEYLSINTPSSRSTSNIPVDKPQLYNKLREFAEGWFAEEHGKTTP